MNVQSIGNQLVAASGVLAKNVPKMQLLCGVGMGHQRFPFGACVHGGNGGHSGRFPYDEDNPEADPATGDVAGGVVAEWCEDLSQGLG